jgi:hypothetical protein
MQSSPTSITSFFSGPNILLSSLFSNTLRLCSSLNVRDQFLHPYKTTGKIVVLYILIFRFLISLLLKDKSRLWDHHAVCVPVYAPLINVWMPEPIFMKLGMYIMALKAISNVLYKSLSLVCVCICTRIPLPLPGNGSVIMLTEQWIHKQ